MVEDAYEFFVRVEGRGGLDFLGVVVRVLLRVVFDFLYLVVEDFLGGDFYYRVVGLFVVGDDGEFFGVGREFFGLRFFVFYEFRFVLEAVVEGGGGYFYALYA